VRLKKLTLKNRISLESSKQKENITTKSTTRSTITRRSQKLKLKFKLLLLPRPQFHLLRLHQHQRAFLPPRVNPVMHSKLNPRLLMSQSMRSELLPLRFHQHTSTTTSNLLLSRVSERLSDMIPSTPSSRRTEMRRRIFLTTTTSPSA